MKVKTIALALIAGLLIGVTQTAYSADNALAEQKYEEAKVLFTARDDESKNDSAITTLEEALKLVDDKELNFDILILLTQAYYFKAQSVKGDSDASQEQRKNIYTKSKSLAETARALASSYAEGWYFYGSSLARWGEANGVMNSLFAVPEVKEKMAEAKKRKMKNGRPGKEIDYYGPNRLLGRLYFKLPWPLGDTQKSIELLEEAYEEAPKCLRNAVYLADSINSEDKQRACELLSDVLSEDAETFNPDLVAENKGDQEEAKKLFKRFRCK